MDHLFDRLRRLVRELRRRRVFRVAVVYAGTAFIVLQVFSIALPALHLPEWTMTFVVVLLLIGAPIALVLAWAFEVTPEGMVRVSPHDPPAAPRPAHGGKPFTGDAAILTMLLVIAGLLVYPYLWSSGPDTAAEGSGELTADSSDALFLPEAPSVAVLPFTYLAAEDSADYFSLGMTDELLTRLSQIEGLPVIARTSVMQYQKTAKTIPEIGRELGVSRIVEGSVQQVGRQVRIQAQLIDARTGRHLWAKGFTRPFEDVLQLQSEIAGEIAASLELELLPSVRRQLAEERDVDSTAYMLYLQARELRFQETSGGRSQARSLLARSIALDSTFAPAWALMSYCQRWSDESAARTAAQRALALDSTSAEAQIAMGNVWEGLELNFPAAGSYFKRAVELNPGLADAHREYGLYLGRMGQFDVAGRYLRKSAKLDPASPAPWQALGWIELWRGNYRRAQDHMQQALMLQPDYSVATIYLTDVYLAQGQAEKALRQARMAVKRAAEAGAYAVLGRSFALSGQRDSARMQIDRMREEFGSIPWGEAIIHTALGETDRALDLLEQQHYYYLKVNPWWEPLRGEPRYQRLLEQMGLDDASVRQTMEKLGERPS